MNFLYAIGAMYARLNKEEMNKIERDSVKLGDGVLNPGEFVRKLGEKKRSSFEMQDGYFLRYEGRLGKYLLFGVNDIESQDGLFYAFGYVDPNTLIVGNKSGGWDVRIKTLEKFMDDELFFEPKQLSLFDF